MLIDAGRCLAPSIFTCIDVDPAGHVERTAQRLRAEFGGVLSHEAIDDVVADSRERMQTGSAAAGRGCLAERLARERLEALARAEGSSATVAPEVLFVCVQNAGRSQMAAGLVTLRSGGRVRVRSAGSRPAGTVNPLVVEVMGELGVDLAEAFPKPLTDEVVRAADVVVTMGCGDACPIYPGKRYEDWQVDDPADASSLEEVRRIRDDIDERVQRLLPEVLTAENTSS